MNPQGNPGEQLKYWQAQQQNFGYLMWIALGISVLPIVDFLLSPTVGSGLLVSLCLLGLTIACLRLLHSAARVASLRAQQTVAIPGESQPGGADASRPHLN
jgi:hypothetical protein